MKEIKIRPRPRSSKVCTASMKKKSETGCPGEMRLNETEKDPSEDQKIRGKIMESKKSKAALMWR